MMTNTYKLIIILLLAISFTSCEKVVEGVNDNPNQFEDVPPAQFLVNNMAINVAGLVESNPARYATMFTDQMEGCDRQYKSVNSYSVAAASFDETWSDIFYDGIGQAATAIEKAKGEGRTDLVGTVNILKGYFFGEAAILFGDVPFSEAGNYAQFPNPKFDSQPDVIKGAIALIDEGVAQVGESAVSSTFTSTAITTNGGTTWKQFGDALKARFYLALKDYPNALKYAKESGITSLGQGVYFKHYTGNGAENLWYQFEAEQRGGYICWGNSTLIKMINPSDTINYRGNAKTNESARYASYASGSDLNVSKSGYFGIDALAWIVSAQEVNLIIAECEARAGNESEALGALNAARANNASEFGGQYDAYDSGDFDAGAMANLKEEDKATAMLREIMTEKFISVLGLPTYSDVRRTNNFLGVRVKNPNTEVIPARFLYPSTEKASNSNFPKDNDPGLYDPTPVNM